MAWIAGCEKTEAVPCRAESNARVVKSSAVSSSSEATTPRTLAPASVAFGPIRSMTAPATGPRTSPGSPNATPNSDTSPTSASNSKAA